MADQVLRGRGHVFDPVPGYGEQGWMVWNSSAIFTPQPREMRYSVSMYAEFFPSSIFDS